MCREETMDTPANPTLIFDDLRVHYATTDALRDHAAADLPTEGVE